MFDEDGDEGESEGYIGLMFLGAQDPGGTSGAAFVSLANFRMFAGSQSYDSGGDPTNDEERYATMDGTSPNSLQPPDPVTGLIPSVEAKKADDYRILVSAGPFAVVESGETLGFQAALVLGLGFDGMVANAVQAQLTFDGVYLDCDEDPTTGVSNRETKVCPSEDSSPSSFPIAGTWPVGESPTLGNVDWCESHAECEFAPQADPNCWVVLREECEYINADCKIEEQTGFDTGTNGRECLIRWLVGTAPPPPRMRLVTSENKIEVSWNNLSETTPDLRLNVKDFESYRVWRADNWDRPLGTDVATGPGSSLWMLLAEFDLPLNNIGSDTGLDDVRYAPAIPDDAVQFYREWFAAHPLLQPPDLPGFSEDQLDTAKALAQGVRYYLYTDPPFKVAGCINNSNDHEDCVTGRCPSNGDECPPILTSSGPVYTRCNSEGLCQEVAPPPHSGAHYFYSVTATDHKVEIGSGGRLVATGPGLAGDPNSSFEYVTPPTNALQPEKFDQAKDQIYVVPNPATVRSMEPWQLNPNNDDPTGVKVEFHHLPATRGKVTVFTLSGDMVIELPFDNRGGKDSLAWDLLSRNGQEVTSGVYLYAVEADHPDWSRFTGRFVVIR
jgi:hypothetical protein